LAFIFNGLSGCGFPHLQAIAFYSLPTGPNFGVHLILTRWLVVPDKPFVFFELVSHPHPALLLFGPLPGQEGIEHGTMGV
jgi:hypothetical protein